MFARKGVVIVPKAQVAKEVAEDDVLDAVLDAGAEDVNDIGEAFRGHLGAERPGGCADCPQAAGLDYESAEASFVPSMTVAWTSRAPPGSSG
jgi:transcriptional/translational regulatory protein YebC/TACO1